MREMPNMATIPAFLAKLWKLVDDPETDDLISWNASGQSFVISNTVRFTQELLPMYYKHNNLASFIRQLNMYGFHKVVSVESGGLKSEKDTMEFCHTYFFKGHPYLMQNIKRKMPMNKNNPSLSFVKDLEKDSSGIGESAVLSHVLSEMKGLKEKQADWDAKLSVMKRENESLWRELAIFRQKHLKQEQIINRLINFIVRTVSSRNMPLRRRLPLMLDDVERVGKASTSPKGPTICELDDLFGETSSAKQGAKSGELPHLTHDPTPEDEQEPPYRSHYVVMSPEEAVDVQQPSPWLLSDGSDFDSEAMTPVNPLLISLPSSNFEDTGKQSKQDSELLASAVKRGRKILPAKKKTVLKKNRDILQETMSLINLEPTDIASPGSSGAIPQNSLAPVKAEAEENTESSANILKILEHVASQDIGVGMDKPEEVAMDSTVAMPNTSFGSDNVASELGSHVDTVQNDLDVLRDFLKGESYNLDANTLLELFNDDPMSLIMTQPEKDDTKEGNNELMMYTNTPSILDFGEVYGTTAAPSLSPRSSPIPPLSPSILETPVMTPATPGFSSAKRRRK